MLEFSRTTYGSFIGTFLSIKSESAFEKQSWINALWSAFPGDDTQITLLAPPKLQCAHHGIALGISYTIQLPGLVHVWLHQFYGLREQSADRNTSDWTSNFVTLSDEQSHHTRALAVPNACCGRENELNT
jgi:hypothetical protein